MLEVNKKSLDIGYSIYYSFNYDKQSIIDNVVYAKCKQDVIDLVYDVLCKHFGELEESFEIVKESNFRTDLTPEIELSDDEVYLYEVRAKALRGWKEGRNG